ncbi:MAG: family 16 glycosylhydrolase [Specibacter sp.]
MNDSDFNDDFHVFGINRTPEKLEWLLDGQVYKCLLFSSPDPVENERRQAAAAGMLRPMYLQINLATGGNWAGDAGDSLAEDETEFVVDWVQYSQTDAQQVAEQAYYSSLPVLGGVTDLSIRQGQRVSLAEHVSASLAGYEVVWSVTDTPMFVNGGAPGGRNEVKLVASSRGTGQTTAELPIGVYTVYYTALPVGTDQSGTYKSLPSIPARRAKATLAVLPADGLKGNPRAAVASVKMPAGWTFTKPSQKLNRNDTFDVRFVNPLDVTVSSETRLPANFTIPRDAITW